MSGWKGHTSLGFFCTIITLLVINYFQSVSLNFILLSFIVSFFYSQLPDIDIQSSKIRWFLTVLGIGMAFVQLVFFHNTKLAILFMGVVIIIWVLGLIKGFKHRGFTHTIICGILLSAIMCYYNPLLMIIALVNYLSHLFLDKRKRKAYK